MPGHECYHYKKWIEARAAHDCWTTTEAALTRDLPEDLQDAWERLRETAADFGEQRIYASSRKVANLLLVTHRDEAEAPMTDCIREAYESSDRLSGRGQKPKAPRRRRHRTGNNPPKRKR